MTRFRVGPENTSNLTSLCPRDGAYQRSYLPSNSSPYSDDHMPSPITLKLSRNIEHRSYNTLTANRSVVSLGSPLITPKPP